MGRGDQQSAYRQTIKPAQAASVTTARNTKKAVNLSRLTAFFVSVQIHRLIKTLFEHLLRSANSLLTTTWRG